MFARVVEVMLAAWLAVSPFVFHHPPGRTALWVNDLLCAASVATFALVSFWNPLRHAHLLTVAVGLWLVVRGYVAGYPLEPAVENGVVLGWLLMMFGIVPDHVAAPPKAWRDHYARRSRGARASR